MTKTPAQVRAGRAYYERNKELTKQRAKLWKENNKEAVSRSNKEYWKSHWKKYRDLLIGEKCYYCGFDIIEALDYHHVNSDNKVDTVSNLISRFKSDSDIYEEINKCLVLCGNCHAKVTSIDNNRGNGKSSKTKGYLWYLQYKESLSCEYCNYSDSCALQFHHTDPSNKVMNVSAMADGLGAIGIPKLIEEISKCEVLCVNCHRIYHRSVSNGSD